MVRQTASSGARRTSKRLQLARACKSFASAGASATRNCPREAHKSARLRTRKHRAPDLPEMQALVRRRVADRLFHEADKKAAEGPPVQNLPRLVFRPSTVHAGKATVAAVARRVDRGETAVTPPSVEGLSHAWRLSRVFRDHFVNAHVSGSCTARALFSIQPTDASLPATDVVIYQSDAPTAEDILRVFPTPVNAAEKADIAQKLLHTLNAFVVAGASAKVAQVSAASRVAELETELSGAKALLRALNAAAKL